MMIFLHMMIEFRSQDRCSLRNDDDSLKADDLYTADDDNNDLPRKNLAAQFSSEASALRKTKKDRSPTTSLSTDWRLSNQPDPEFPQYCVLLKFKFDNKRGTYIHHIAATNGSKGLPSREAVAFVLQDYNYEAEDNVFVSLVQRLQYYCRTAGDEKT
ncbi:unnamed protein product [Calypogeia fissa]